MKIRLAGFEPTTDWVGEIGARVEEPADVSVWHPDHTRPTGPALMFLDVREDSHGVFHPDAAAHVATTAGAYAGCVEDLRSALDWFGRGAPRPSRGVVFLGSLGTQSCGMPIGTPFPVESRVVLGRGRRCDVLLRHGAHSDQNVCARNHAILERTPEGIVVTDLRSTNGTFVDGALIDAPTPVSAGSEIAFAGYFRFLVCA